MIASAGAGSSSDSAFNQPHELPTVMTGGPLSAKIPSTGLAPVLTNSTPPAALQGIPKSLEVLLSLQESKGEGGPQGRVSEHVTRPTRPHPV